MKLRIGMFVRIVRSRYPHRVGQVHRIIGESESGTAWAHALPIGSHLFELDAPSELSPGTNIGYPESHLEPYHEPGDFQSLDELMRSVRGVTVKERV